MQQDNLTIDSHSKDEEEKPLSQVELAVVGISNVLANSHALNKEVALRAKSAMETLQTGLEMLGSTLDLMDVQEKSLIRGSKGSEELFISLEDVAGLEKADVENFEPEGPLPMALPFYRGYLRQQRWL